MMNMQSITTRPPAQPLPNNSLNTLNAHEQEFNKNYLLAEQGCVKSQYDCALMKMVGHGTKLNWEQGCKRLALAMEADPKREYLDGEQGILKKIPAVLIASIISEKEKQLKDSPETRDLTHHDVTVLEGRFKLLSEVLKSDLQEESFDSFRQKGIKDYEQKTQTNIVESLEEPFMTKDGWQVIGQSLLWTTSLNHLGATSKKFASMFLSNKRKINCLNIPKEDLIKFFEYCNNLKVSELVIRIKGSYDKTPEPFRALLLGLSFNKNVKTINLGIPEFGLQIDGTKLLAANLTNLTGLDIRSNNLGAAPSEKKDRPNGAEHLSVLTKLNGLNMSWNNLTGDCLRFLTALTALTWLDIGKNQVQHYDGMQYLTRLTNLKVLNASAGYPKIKPGDIEPLSKLTTLERLCLSDAAIGKGGAGIEHLAGLTNLIKLNLYGTFVDSGALIHLKQLTKLFILIIGPKLGLVTQRLAPIEQQMASPSLKVGYQDTGV
jgi:hypothetical protein